MVPMMLPYSAVMLISPQQPHYCHRCQHQHAHHLNHRHNHHHLIITIVIIITIIISIIIIKIIVIRNHFGWNLCRQQTTGRLPWANGLYFLEDGDLARFIVELSTIKYAALHSVPPSMPDTDSDLPC